MNPRSFYTSAVATEHYLGIRWPREIWAAVLKQAIKDVVEGPTLAETTEYVTAPGHGWSIERQRRFQNEVRGAAQDWIDDDENEPRRFVWVCEQLGLDPAAVRAELVRKTNI